MNYNRVASLKGVTNMWPRISVVTPSLNQGAFIEDAVLSVLRQEYPNFEHIIVDGSSTDGTVDFLRRSPHLRWTSERDKGQSNALNKGLRMATGHIVGWLNSDDRYRPGCFEKIVQAFRRFPDTDVIYGDYTYVNEHGCVFQNCREIEFSHFILRYNHVLYIPTTATFFRRRVVDEGNLIDERFDYAMDYEFFLRLAEKGYRFKHVPYLLADYRWHPRSKSSSQPGKQRQEHDQIAQTYSPILRRLPEGWWKKCALQVLRIPAKVLRYSEKLLKGYYFEQFRSPSLSTAGQRRKPGQE